jgi:hypothetical protein
VLLPVALLAGALVALYKVAKDRVAQGQVVISRAAAPRCGVLKVHTPLVGVAPATPWGADLVRFRQIIKVNPQIVASYVPFGSPFDVAKACSLTRMGALPLIQMLPRHATLTDISAGKYDNYLTAYANDIKKSGLRVAFSFAHEMNGQWYPWGFKHVTPTVFIDAWRHIHEVFQRAGATRVIWCWNPNGGILNMTQETPPRLWWPGSAYVDWVGVDAYFNRPSEDYATAIGPNIAMIRKFTSKPILIAETAIGRGPAQVTQINSLFAGIRSSHGVVGFIWFNTNRRRVWRLNGRPAAIAAFQQEAQSLR